MALNGGGAFGAGFNDIGIDCALGKKLCVAVFCGFLIENVNKVFADNFALLFRLGYAVKSFKEAAFGIDANKGEVAGAERGFHLVAFVFAHKTGIDKNADRLAGDCLCKQRGTHGGIDAAGKTENYAFVSDLFTNGGNLIFDEIIHIIVARGMAVTVDKVAEHGFAVFCGVYFRVELGCHKAAAFIDDCGKGAIL